ncbi:MAG: hypothetical protein KGL58_09650 [Pseudomonadota bacterium]|nr:hypothetical protein [Pseudomonadota bacterium]
MASADYHARWQSERMNLVRQQGQLQDRQIHLGALLARLQALTLKRPVEANRSVERAAASLLLLMRQNQMRDRVRLAGVEALAGGHFSAHPEAFTPLQHRVPDTDGRIGQVSLEVRGHYSDYTGLKAFLAALHAYPVALVGMNETKQEFDLKLAVFGRNTATRIQRHENRE